MRPAGRSTVAVSGSYAAVDGAGLALAGSAVLAVRGLPGSGTPIQQMEQAGIGSSAIVSAARALA